MADVMCWGQSCAVDVASLHAVMSDSCGQLSSLNCCMTGATVHCCVQVNVAIMLAPVAFLGHITSQPVEAMARMETDKVSSQNCLLQRVVPTAGFLYPEPTASSRQLLCSYTVMLHPVISHTAAAFYFLGTVCAATPCF